MALNRQQILSELGSVMNQLQSADCGCMGKLFGQPGQNTQYSQGNNLPTCGGCRRGSCYGHGFPTNSGSPCGEPCAGSGRPASYHCMGHCNPPKLYADTYNYLNSNLMQPVVKEVYDDLRNITPENTVTNNPLANQMGLIPSPGNAGDTVGSNMMQSQGNPGKMPQNPGQNMNNMHGMGPQIMNILGGNSNAKPNYAEGQGGQYGGQMETNAHQAIGNNSEARKHSGPISNSGYQGNTFANPAQNVNQFSMPHNQYIASNNENMIPTGQQHTNINANPAEKQMSAPPHHNHGIHSQGIAKFKEMFPGVMQGVGGDLGFDPMSIAIQMNPANQQQAAMDAMQKIMNNNNGVNKSLKEAGGTGMAEPGSNSIINSSPNQNSPQHIQGNVLPSKPRQSEVVYTNITSNQQTKVPSGANNNKPYQVNQQINPAIIGTQAINQQQQPYPLQYQERAVIDPNSVTGITPHNLPTIHEGMSQYPTSKVQGVDNLNYKSVAPEQMIRDPIFPADNSRYTYSPAKQQKYFEYNTLGQPIEAIPAKRYHTPEPDLPQTLSPQPVPFKLPATYNNVKSTISKTSLVQNRPIGKTPSRGQLQQIYNQYKGSQSLTQQNVREPDGISRSDGRLYLAQNNTSIPNKVPIEKNGGDSAANNQMQSLQVREQVIGQIGDVPVVNKPAPAAPEKVSPLNKKCRNGLQDMVYTSYPTSTAWTFHGHGREAYSAGYRYRNRI